MIPTKLRVLGQDIAVSFVPSSHLGDDAGVWDRDHNLILINEALPSSQKELTFFHELMHVINGEMDEEKSEFLASIFYTVLKDNEMLR
jgi:Zn-dependent peptidase ImmA (M78 family)